MFFSNFLAESRIEKRRAARYTHASDASLSAVRTANAPYSSRSFTIYLTGPEISDPSFFSRYVASSGLSLVLAM